MMKKSDRLHRHYDKLTAVERVNLVLSAQERSDEAEVDALENACPTAQSLDYEGRVLGLASNTALLVIQLLACQVLLITKSADLEDAPGATPDPALRSLLEREAAIWHGFAAWCRDVGHDPHQLLRFAPMGTDERDPAFFIIHDQIETIEGRAQDAAGDTEDPFPAPAKVHMWREVFTRLFQPVAVLISRS